MGGRQQTKLLLLVLHLHADGGTAGLDERKGVGDEGRVDGLSGLDHGPALVVAVRPVLLLPLEHHLAARLQHLARHHLLPPLLVRKAQVHDAAPVWDMQTHA